MSSQSLQESDRAVYCRPFSPSICQLWERHPVEFMKKLEDQDFTDDLALLTHCLQDMQENIDSSGEASQHVGLKISKEKTKVMHATKMQEAQISIRGALVEDVDEFVYLGSKISQPGGTDGYIAERTRKARQAFTILLPVWKSTVISTHTKLRVFN